MQDMRIQNQFEFEWLLGIQLPWGTDQLIACQIDCHTMEKYSWLASLTLITSTFEVTAEIPCDLRSK